MKLKVLSILTENKQIELGASVNRTYIIVYQMNNVTTDGLILLEEVKGFYTFIVNKDFRLLYNGNPNIQISIDGKDLKYFAKVGLFDLMKLYFYYKRLWIQKEDNIRWLLNIIIALVATYAAYRLK